MTADTKGKRFEVRISDAERAAWDAAAEADGRTTSDWLRNLANRASGLMPPAKGRGKPAKGPERKRQGRVKK